MTSEERPSHEATFAAVEAGAAFVQDVRRRSAARDWDRVLGEIRRALEQIVASDLVTSDPEASAILTAMTAAPDMEEFDHLAGRLHARVAELAASAAGEAAPPAVGLSAGGRAASPFARSEAAFGGARGRTLLKL